MDPLWTTEDRFSLANLSVPVPTNEQKRVEILRKSKLLDSSGNDTGFSRFTSLSSRLFNMPFAAVSFVEVERVVFKARLGLEMSEISRNDWFDAYTVLPDSSEVYVVVDCSQDARFKDKAFVRGPPHIRFYAGAAIMVEGQKIGVLSILDTAPHRLFSLEDKENLLDLGAAAAQLAKEKLQTALNLSAERASIVVSMMHHLRTPMTSLNFATSLLCNDVHTLRTEHQPSSSSNQAQPPSSSDRGHLNNDNSRNSVSGGGRDGNNQVSSESPALLQSFESSFMEISHALDQLNILVDSSLSLGQAIVQCSAHDFATPTPLHHPAAQAAQTSGSQLPSALDPRSRFSECRLLDYLRDVFHHHLPVHNPNLSVEWLVDTKDLDSGAQVTFPDAVLLVVISTIAHLSADSQALAFHFAFQPCEDDEREYPELADSMREGRLSIKVFARDEDDDSSVANSATSGGSSGGGDTAPAMLLSRQNFLSIDKILRAINGSSREHGRVDVSTYCLRSSGNPAAGTATTEELHEPMLRHMHEFLVPCKILSASQARRAASVPDASSGPLYFYRPSARAVSMGRQPAGVQVSSLSAPPSQPVAESVSAAPQTQSASQTQSVAAAGRRLRVLVVEDTLSVQKLLTRWLQQRNCDVVCASNGKLGLEQLMSTDVEPFDLAFVDFLMPIMLGITTMKLFQQWHTPTSSSLEDQPPVLAPVEAKTFTPAPDNAQAQVLLVGMSATALESEQEEAFRFGMHFFCPKPVSLDLLSLILGAVRDSVGLNAAIDRICEVTGTAAENDAEMDASQRLADDPSVPQTVASEDDDAQSRARFTFFRSCRQFLQHQNLPQHFDQQLDSALGPVAP